MTMTAVGKIFVFLNLVFSLVVGFLVLMSYSARTQWATGYDKLKKDYQVVAASRNAYQAEANRVQTQAGEQEAKLQAQIKKLQDDLAREQSRGKDLSTELLAVQKKAAQHEAVVKASQGEVQRRQEDFEQLRKTLQEETDRNVQVVKDANQQRDRAVAAEIQFQSVQEQNQRLVVQLEQMAKDIARIRAGGGGTATSPGRSQDNPPPEAVEGLVKNTDPSGLMTITIGSDAGLARGQTLDVYRLGTNPRWLGKIRLIEVTPNQAVGQPVGRMNGTPQPGDRVGNNLTSR